MGVLLTVTTTWVVPGIAAAAGWPGEERYRQEFGDGRHVGFAYTNVHEGTAFVFATTRRSAEIVAIAWLPDPDALGEAIEFPVPPGAPRWFRPRNIGERYGWTLSYASGWPFRAAHMEVSTIADPSGDPSPDGWPIAPATTPAHQHLGYVAIDFVILAPGLFRYYASQDPRSPATAWNPPAVDEYTSGGVLIDLDGSREIPLPYTPIWTGLLGNVAVFTAGAWLTFFTVAAARGALAKRHGRCPHCRYDLTGITGVCPECGNA